MQRARQPEPRREAEPGGQRDADCCVFQRGPRVPQRIEGARIEARLRRREQAHRRAGQDHPHVPDVVRGEPPAAEERRHRDVPEGEEGDHRGHYRKGDGAKPRGKLPVQRLARSLRRRHGRQGSRRDRHAEERDGERVQRLRVAERGDGAARQPRGDDVVDVGAQLDDSAPGHDGKEAARHVAHVGVCAAEREPQPPAETGKHRRQLHADLEQRPHHGAPGGDDGQIEGAEPEAPPSEDERGDLRRAPHHRRDVAEEEAMVAVQDPEAERREDEQRRSREEDADQQDGERALVAREAGSDGVDEERRRGDADHRERGGDDGEQSGDGAGDLARFLLVALRAERCVDRDERGAEDAFPEKVLEEVGNLEGGVVRVGRVGGAEVVPEDALPDESRETAEEDPGGDERGSALASRPFRRSRRSRRHFLGRGAHRPRRIAARGAEQRTNRERKEAGRPEGRPAR